MPEGNPNELEVCRVRERVAIEFLGQGVYFVWDRSAEVWVEGGVIAADEFVCVSRSRGGYCERLGFTGVVTDIPGGLPVQGRSHRVGNGWARSQNVTLRQHSLDALGFARSIVAGLGLDEEMRELVCCAAQWHDYGKAHSQFQGACGVGGEVWAKRTSMGRYRHPGFRHELASAIGVLMQGRGFELAYLVAAHHGKCRMQ
ncbi:MAG: CRISPR-associated endonuclease Cas3'', partial [Leptolyngbya sp. Prado105]|nr:CRISPR-associated endonuclease Cas3'' [Leptolyngbya sp. Prado105]